MSSYNIEDRERIAKLYEQRTQVDYEPPKKIKDMFDEQALIFKQQEERRKSDMELSKITSQLKNRLDKNRIIQEDIVTKYIEKRIPILNDIIENSTNTEKNEKLYAKDMLELLKELDKMKIGQTAGWNIEKIFKLDESFKNFKSGSESIELTNISNLIDELKKCLENVKLDVNNITDKHYITPLNKLNDIINGLKNIQIEDYLVQEKYLKDSFSFKNYQDIIVKLNKDINTNYSVISTSLFSKLIGQIIDIKNNIKYTLNSDILEKLRIIDNEFNLLIKEERDVELLLKTKKPSKEDVKKLNNEVNSILTNINNNINMNKQKEKDIIVTKEYNTNKTIKTSLNFKILLVVISLLVITLILLLIFIPNTPVRITLGILIPFLIGGSFYYYKKNKGYIQIKKINKSD